jgi:hypothetical protein
MMHTVKGGMVHQVSKAHGVLRPVPNREFHNAVENPRPAGLPGTSAR